MAIDCIMNQELNFWDINYNGEKTQLLLKIWLSIMSMKNNLIEKVIFIFMIFTQRMYHCLIISWEIYMMEKTINNNNNNN